MDGFYDIHSHFLPGVDDGAKDQDSACKLLAAYEKMGVKGIYLTPHIINGMYDSADEKLLRQKFGDFDHGTGMDIRLAAEYFIDDRFLEHMSGDPLTFSDRHVLAEFAMASYGMNSFDQLFEATISGINIIIAHPERYAFVQNDKRDEVLNLLTNSHYKLQLNILSLVGYHGSEARNVSHRLLSEGLYTFVGTDVHSFQYVNAIENESIPSKLYPELEKLKENNKMLFG